MGEEKRCEKENVRKRKRKEQRKRDRQVRKGREGMEWGILQV